MTESPPAPPASLAEAHGWAGFRVDDLNGAEVGQARALFVDAQGGEPSWLIVRQGRFRGTLVAVPFADCAAAGGRVWVAHERERIRQAPVVDPTRPLLREHELTICSHFGIGGAVGRAATVAGRDEATVTSKPS